MIKSKEDYRMFLREDALANIKCESCSWFKMRLNIWYGNDSYRFLEYLRALRYYEYLLNCKKGVLARLRITIAKIHYHRLGAAINVNINPNVVGYGFRVPHLTGGVIINCKSVGHNCTANAGVIIGNNNKGGMAIVGNNVDMTIGSKIIGGVTIGSNVIVAPNSVVVKDVPDNAVVSGIPAKILSIHGQNVQNDK